MGRLTHHMISGNKAKFAEITAVVSVVSQHQVVIIGHDHIIEGSAAASWRHSVLQNVPLLAKQSLLASLGVAVLCAV